MKGLPTLIRLQQRELDTLRKRMVILAQRKENLEKQSEQLLEDLKKEVELAGQLAGMAGFFGDFSAHIKKQREQIAKEVKKVEKKIIKVNEEIFDAFCELKKYEVALEHKLKEEKKREEKRDLQLMDEIAARKHRRHREGNLAG